MSAHPIRLGFLTVLKCRNSMLCVAGPHNESFEVLLREDASYYEYPIVTIWKYNITTKPFKDNVMTMCCYGLVLIIKFTPFLREMMDILPLFLVPGSAGDRFWRLAVVWIRLSNQYCGKSTGLYICSS